MVNQVSEIKVVHMAFNTRLFETIEIQKFDSTTVPCQYWYDNKWYDLTDVSDDTGYIMSTPNGPDAGSQPWAAYNFCRKVNQASDY